MKNKNFDSEDYSNSILAPTIQLPATTVLTCIVAWILIAISMSFSKFIYSEKKLSCWEDIYGRSLVGTILAYGLMVVKDTSPFDVPANIRNKLFMMQISFIVAFGLIMVGLTQLSALT